jgi:hypothetical protein
MSVRKSSLIVLAIVGLSLLQGVQNPTTAKAALATSGLALNLDASVAGSFSSGTWQDQSGNSRNATAVNSPTYDATDGSFTFNGTNQYFNLGNILNFTSAFSIEVTFMPNSITGNQMIVARQNSGVAGNYFVGMGGAKANYYVESSPWGLTSTSNLSIGTKYTSTLVYDSAKAITPYLNGVQDGTKTTFSGNLFTNTINLQIGAGLNSNSASDFFNGKIYSVRIYNRALSSAEVNENYAESTRIVLSNWAGASGCSFNGSQRHGTKIYAGTTSTITKVRLQIEFNSPDSVINATQVDIHTDASGAVGTLVGTLRPSVLDAASTLSGATIQTRRVAFTGAVNVTSGTTYWLTFNGNGNTISVCGTGNFAIQASSWSVPKSGSDFFLRFSGGSSYTTWPNIFQFELSLGPADTTAPVITGPGSLTTATVSASTNENTTWTHQYSANEGVTWSITGVDSATFTISTGGLLTLSAKNFEVRSDANLDGIFTVTVRATDSSGNIGTQALNVTIVDANDAPVITINSGASSHSISVFENQTTIITYTGTDADTNTALQWVFADNTFDQNKFNINSSSGVLTFKAAPDFEVRADTNADNVYRVNIGLSDGTILATQVLLVTILDVNEVSSIAVPTIATAAIKGITINLSVVADTPGRVQFFYNGKRIPNCSSISTSGAAPTATAICVWKPANHGVGNITARVTPTNTGLSASVSPPLRVVVGKRTTLR